MKIFGVNSSMNIKLALILIGASIALGTLFYTQNLVEKLQEREKQIVQLFANSLETIASAQSIDTDFTFIFQNIILRIDFPMIVTDGDDQLADAKEGIGYKNIEIDKSFTSEQVKLFLRQKRSELENSHPPIIVKAPDGKPIQKIYYGDSEIVRQLKFYPYLQISIALLFLLIAYISFNYVRRSEQSNIWVGMSKETAHQLGTPISSLMGWNEILRINYNNPDKVLDTAEEIDSDLIRLNKITKRFSKIGSKPELHDEAPFEVIQKVITYFQRRLPQVGKNVTLTVDGDKEIKTKLNSELFEWVIENLIKNALDAIENKNGEIKFFISSQKDNLEIEVSDNGKGIEYKNRKDIFRPGFSTKRRGWGLGLSLSRRIIENYHKGKIFVKDSVINQGTVFKIILSKSEKST